MRTRTNRVRAPDLRNLVRVLRQPRAVQRREEVVLHDGRIGREDRRGERGREDGEHACRGAGERVHRRARERPELLVERSGERVDVRDARRVVRCCRFFDRRRRDGPHEVREGDGGDEELRGGRVAERGAVLEGEEEVGAGDGAAGEVVEVGLLDVRCGGQLDFGAGSEQLEE